MGSAQWLLELALLLLLAATLFHAMRLERALGVLKRDRAVLEELVTGFNDSTRQAEAGIERLRTAADGAGRQMARQIESGQKLRDDLQFLAERSDRLAERLETALRSARMFADSTAMAPPANETRRHMPVLAEPPREGSGYVPADTADHHPGLLTHTASDEPSATMPRLRSQAERDLLRVLRAGR